MKYVGGPMDGKESDSESDIVSFPGYSMAMVYHRTRPTDTDWRMRLDPMWFEKNLPEPVLPDHVYEWHELDWQSPEVRMIRGAVLEATQRVFG